SRPFRVSKRNWPALPRPKLQITLSRRIRRLTARQMHNADPVVADDSQSGSSRPVSLEAALDYEKRGFSVILLHGIVNGLCTCGKPGCSSPGKHPIGSWKRAQTARATAAELEAAFARYPDANVGIVTGALSGLIVIDLDGPAGENSCQRVMRGHDPPVGPKVRTGSGYHLYGRHPGKPLKNFVKNHPGLDGRADGGYVV